MECNAMRTLVRGKRLFELLFQRSSTHVSYQSLCNVSHNRSPIYVVTATAEFDFPDPYWKDISDAAKDLVCKLLVVDPKKRFTPDQILGHAWISGGAASDRKMGNDHGKRLKTMQARRRLRRGVHMIIAINKFKELFEEDDDDDI
jgi:serine/threonine protein kinase